MGLSHLITPKLFVLVPYLLIFWLYCFALPYPYVQRCHLQPYRRNCSSSAHNISYTASYIANYRSASADQRTDASLTDKNCYASGFQQLPKRPWPTYVRPTYIGETKPVVSHHCGLPILVKLMTKTDVAYISKSTVKSYILSLDMNLLTSCGIRVGWWWVIQHGW